MFWESNPTNIESPSGECFAGDGNTLATGDEGIFKLGEGSAELGEGFAGGGEGFAGGGNELAAGGGGVAVARWGSAPLSLFASRRSPASSESVGAPMVS